VDLALTPSTSETTSQEKFAQEAHGRVTDGARSRVLLLGHNPSLVVQQRSFEFTNPHR
jgi:hypothetical protein